MTTSQNFAICEVNTVPNSHTDLTQGSIRRQLIRYAVPIVISSLLQALYGVADMLIVSRFLGDVGASAVNNASQITRFATQVVIGLSSGGGVLIGQFFGAREHEKQDRAIGTFFTCFALLGLAVSVLLGIFSRTILSALRAPALEDANSYLFVCAMGMFFVFGYNMLSSVLRALGNSKTPLYCIIVATVLNVILDIIFVGKLGLGTAGAALATIIAQAGAFFGALLYLLRRRELFSFSAAAFRPDTAIAKRIFAIGAPAAVQMSIASLSWLTVTYLINDYGIAYSAANGIAAKIRDFPHIFISSMNIGTAAIIAQTLGAEKFDRARDVMYTAMRMSLLITAASIVVVELTAPFLAAIFIDDPLVINIAARNLRIEIIGEMFYASFLIYHSLMMGAGHSHMALISSFVNCIVFRFVLALLFNALWGINGIFLACAVAPASSIPVGLYYTRSNKWRRTLAR